jgi:hypothetical protein
MKLIAERAGATAESLYEINGRSFHGYDHDGLNE